MQGLLDGILKLASPVYMQAQKSAAQFSSTPEISTAEVVI